MHVLGTRVPRRLGVARSASSPKAAQALGCSLTPGLRISFGRVTCMARAASVPGLWALGFLLLACVCCWVRVAVGRGFCLPLPVVAGVLGGCVWARFVVLSLFCRLFVVFVVGLWCGPAFGTCVVSCAFPLPPAVSGSGVRCGRACWARVSAVPRPSWLGCRLCFLRFFVFFSFRLLVVLVPGLVVSPPSPFFRAGLLAFFFFFSACFGVPFPVGPLSLAWCCRSWLGGPSVPVWGSCLRCPLGGGFGPLLCCWWAVWWLWAVFARPPPPPLFFFFFFRGGGLPGSSSLRLPSAGGCSVAGVWCGWSLATPGRGSCVLLPATPGWVSLPVVVGGPRHSWLGFAGGGGVWCVAVVCWWGCGWCVVWLVPRHSWRRFLCATPRHSWLGFASGGGGRAPPLLAGVRWRRCCVVCGVWRWCVGGVVAGVWCGWSLATPGGGSCVLLPATPGWVSLPVVVGGPRHSWLGSACGGGVWCVVCGVWRWCVGGVVAGVWCGWSLATPGGGSCVLLPATPGRVSLPVVVGGPRHSWLGSVAGVAVWCVVCGGGVLVGLWLVCGVVGPSPLLAEVPVCYSPPLLAGFRCRWWWAVPATPGWGPLAAVVCGVWCVVCGGGVLVVLWLVSGVVGPSPLLAEVPVCYSPPLLAGFRCRWWWAVPATPGWGPLAAVVCGVLLGSLATPGGGSCVLLPATPGWVSLPLVVGGPRHSWLGSAGGGGVRVLLGRVGRAGLPGALWCASPFPLAALSFCFAWPPPGWGCPSLFRCCCRSSLAGVCGVWVGCCLAPARVPWFFACCARSPGLWHPAAVAAWHLSVCPGCGRRRASLACLVAPRGAPRLVRSGRSRCSGRLSRRRGAFPHPGSLRPRLYWAAARGTRRPAENRAHCACRWPPPRQGRWARSASYLFGAPRWGCPWRVPPASVLGCVRCGGWRVWTRSLTRPVSRTVRLWTGDSAGAPGLFRVDADTFPCGSEDATPGSRACLRVLALLGRVGRAGLPGALWCASPFPLAALSFCFAWPPPGWGCPSLFRCCCRSSLVVFLGLPLPGSHLVCVSRLAVGCSLVVAPLPPPPLCLAVFVAPACGLGVFFFVFFSPSSSSSVRPRCLWLSLVSGPGCPGPRRLRGVFCWFSALRALFPLSCFPPGCWLLPRGCCPPPPFVSRGFRSCRSVLCAVLCCASLGAVPLLVAPCPLALPVALGPCALRRCVLRCSPALCALCCVCFVVARLCLLLFAALPCAVCVSGCCAVRSLCSLFCAVLCFAVLVPSRCAVRVVRAVAGAWCCGALLCVVLFPVVCRGAVLGLVARGCLLVACFGVAVPAWPRGLLPCGWCGLLVCCGALLSCVVFCGAVLSRGAVLLCSAVVLRCFWGLLCPPVGCRAVLCCAVGWLCCFWPGGGVCVLWCSFPRAVRSLSSPFCALRCLVVLAVVPCLPVSCAVALCLVWCCAVVLCCRFAVLFVFALPSCGLLCGACVVCAVVAPRVVACPCALWCLPGRSAVWWCCSGVSWCRAVLCAVLWCPALCAVSCGVVLPCGALLFVFPFVLFSFAKNPCRFSVPLETF